MQKPIACVIDLVRPESQRLWSTTDDDARRRLLSTDPRSVLEIDGSFALVAQDGERVMLARSLDRPLRYFLAKAVDGPVLIVAERIDEIRAELARHGWAEQFHPSYTRMVPAHHVTTLRLVGCPDPNPIHRRFFDPPRESLCVGEIGDECTQVAVVDANQVRAEGDRTIDLGFVVRFHERIHPEQARLRQQLARGAFVADREDHQDGVGAERTGLGDLPGVDQELLAKHGQAGGGPCGAEERIDRSQREADRRRVAASLESRELLQHVGDAKRKREGIAVT